MSAAWAFLVTTAVLTLVVVTLASIDASVEHDHHPAHTLAGLIVWTVALVGVGLLTVLYLGTVG